MAMAGDYIRVHKAMAKVVEDSFHKMAKHCEFHKAIDSPASCDDCNYEGGSNGGVCAREICPILEEE